MTAICMYCECRLSYHADSDLWIDCVAGSDCAGMPHRPNFPRLPEPPMPQPDQTVQQYGLSLLRFLQDTRVTATLDDDQLQTAAHVGSTAVRFRFESPAVYDQLADLERLIHTAIRLRASLQPAEPVQLAGGTTPHRPDVGPMAPLQDRPIARPPTPERVKVDIPF